MRDNRKKNILVTGGCGFMGSAFLRFLFEEAHFSATIVNVDALTYASRSDNLLGCAHSPRYHFYEANITNRSLLEKLILEHEIDLLVHFAAETHVDRSIRDASSFMATNILGTYELLEVVKKYPHIHFHHISTDEVFGSLGEEGTFYEYSPYRPRSPYAASKASADHLVRAYSITHGLKTTISHAVNNFGPYQNEEKLIPKMMTKIIQGKKVPIYGRGAQKRSWIFVDDHARAVWRILERGDFATTYNIPGTCTLTNLEVIETFLTFLRKETSLRGKVEDWVQFCQDRKGHDFHYALDGKKLEDLGYAPKISFEEGLKKTYFWHAKQARKNINKASFHQ